MRTKKENNLKLHTQPKPTTQENPKQENPTPKQTTPPTHKIYTHILNLQLWEFSLWVLLAALPIDTVPSQVLQIQEI